MPSSNSGTMRGASLVDSIASSLRGIFDSAAKNSRPLMVALAALIVGGAGLGYYLNQRERHSEVAADALYLARQAVEKDLVAIAKADAPPAPKAVAKKGEKDKAPPPVAEPTADSVAFKKLDVDARLSQGVGKLQAVTKDFPGTRAAFDARLGLGDLYYNHGVPAKAVTWYREAADSAPSSFERALALYSLGYAFEDSKQAAEAGQAYEKALGLGESAIKGDLLLALARTQEIRKDTAKAKATYDQVLSQLPNTEHAKAAETFKSQLGN